MSHNSRTEYKLASAVDRTKKGTYHNAPYTIQYNHKDGKKKVGILSKRK